MATDLHIGIDAEKVVVSAEPMRVRAGRARRRRTGTVIESLPVPPSGRTRDMRVTFLARLTLPTLFTVAVLYAAGIPAWLLAGTAATALGLFWRCDARRSQQAVFAVPGGARVLRTAEERAAYQRAVEVARRVRRTWPGLSGMIDPVLADRSLTGALDDLATLLVRRQELRRLRAGLSGVPQRAVPDDSPALAALDAQREHAERLWRETAEQANRILRSIDAAALAGETFLHEQRISDTARRAERALARLTVGAPPTESAPDLAHRTAAVLDAYRELAAHE